MSIISAQAKNWSDQYIRPMCDEASRFYKMALTIRNDWNARGGGGIANPVAVPTMVAAAGGTFAAATYSWRYTAINALGETLSSGNATLVVTLNQKVTVTATSVAGATGYNYYRSLTVGSELLVGNSATTTFVDTGAAATGGAYPTSNTTGLIPNDSEQLMDNSPGDGRPVPIVGTDINNLINRCIDLINFFEGSATVATNDGSRTMLNQFLKVSVNP